MGKDTFIVINLDVDVDKRPNMVDMLEFLESNICKLM